MRKIIALDTNLLVLLVVGLTAPRYISVHKKLNPTYGVADYQLLTGLIAASAGVVVTPNVLSEASNLLRQINEPAKTQIALAFREVISRTEEIYVTSADAASRKEFVRLGLSDSSLLEISKRNIVILSVDLDLYLAARAAGYDALNFNYVVEASRE